MSYEAEIFTSFSFCPLQVFQKLSYPDKSTVETSPKEQWTPGLLFKDIQKTKISEKINNLGQFHCPNLGKRDFSRKIGLGQF